METRFRLLGHPVHPMLVTFPVALFTTAIIFDIAYLLTGTEDLAVVAFWTIGVGIVGGLAAAVFGLADWLAIPRGTRARRVGRLHGVGNAVVVALFVVSWLLRTSDAAYPGVIPFILALAGLAIVLVTAWLGGELVYRLRVAVDDDADLDASSSLRRSGVAEVETDRPVRP